MRRLLLLTSFALLAHWTMGQRIGSRAGTELSDGPVANSTVGFGTYVNFNNFSDKFEAMVYGDYSRKKDRLQESEWALIDYQRKAVGVAGLYRIPLADRIAFKLGPALCYNWVEASRRGQDAGWFADHSANYSGIGVMTNLHIERVLNLPVNLDLFAAPSYLMRTTSPFGSASDKALKQLNLQIGASHLFRKLTSKGMKETRVTEPRIIQALVF